MATKKTKIKSAQDLHHSVPPDWYFRSLKENVLQRYWHTRRFREVEGLIEHTPGRILDIGCADGVFTKVILDRSRAKEIVGMDVLKSSVAWAKKHWGKNKKMKFLVGDAHELPFENGSFDAVFALEVLEHVFNPHKVMAEIKRVLKKGGYAVFLVPTDVIYFRLAWDFIWTKTRGRIWKETHIQTYRNGYLVKVCEEAGFGVEKNKKFILGMLQAIKVRRS